MKNVAVRFCAAACCLVFMIGLCGCGVLTSAEAVITPEPITFATEAPSPTPVATPSPSPSPTPVSAVVTLYVPSADFSRLSTVSATAVDSPRGLLNALVDAGALPSVDFGLIVSMTVEDDTVLIGGERTQKRAVRLDLAYAFGQALLSAGSAKEVAYLQCLANTFLDRYEAEAFVLTIEGAVPETGRAKYENAITFDELVKTGGAN